MPVSDARLGAMWREVLELSRVEKGETVVALTGPSSNPRYIEASMSAAQALGATVFRIDMPPIDEARAIGTDPSAYVGATPLDGNAAAMEAMKRADMVIDLMLLLHSPEQEEILKSGTRMLLAVEPPEILARMMPSAADKRRVKAASAEIREAGTMTVTSPAGTDFSCAIGSFPILEEYGFADEPGRWDHWPSGFLATWPNEKTARGTVVLDAGDIIFPFKSYVRSPIEISVEEGFITRIDGGFEAEYLREYMDSFGDPDAFAIAHLGWGLQPKAQWTALGMYDKDASIGMDGRSFYGNFLFSTGPNTEAGGKRNTPCHIDIPMRNCSVSLDGKAMTRDGEVIPEAQRAAA